MNLVAKSDFLSALSVLNKNALRDSVTIELAVCDGYNFLIAYDLTEFPRYMEKLVKDGVKLANRYLEEIATSECLNKDWLSKWIKDNSPTTEDLLVFAEFTNKNKTDAGGLMVFVPTPEYLFAMKCLSMRIDYDNDPEANPDMTDIKNLAKLAGITTAEQAIELLLEFYPENQIEQKTFFGVEAIFAEMSNELSCRSETKGPK